MPKIKFIRFKWFKIFILSFLFVVPMAVYAVSAQAPNIKLQIPILGFTDAADIAVYIKAVYQAATYIVVPIVIVVIILGGIEWLAAAGRDPEGMNRAKSRIGHGLIGLGIVLLSYFLLSFVGITELKPPEVEYIPGIAEDGGELDDYPPWYSEGYTYNKETQTLTKSNFFNLIKEAQAAGAQGTYYNKTFGYANPATGVCEAGKHLEPYTCANIAAEPLNIQKDIVETFKAVCRQLASTNTLSVPARINLISGDNLASYSCRTNKNAKKAVPSIHSYGIAIDIDPFYNPNCKAGSQKCTPGDSRSCNGLNSAKYKEAKAKYGKNGELCTHAMEFGCPCNLNPQFIDTMKAYGFRWGAYNRLLDAMHFEYFPFNYTPPSQ